MQYCIGSQEINNCMKKKINKPEEKSDPKTSLIFFFQEALSNFSWNEMKSEVFEDIFVFGVNTCGCLERCVDKPLRFILFYFISSKPYPQHKQHLHTLPRTRPTISWTTLLHQPTTPFQSQLRKRPSRLTKNVCS